MTSLDAGQAPDSYEDYTVGWICALSLELTAALDMLDDEFEDGPPDFLQPREDKNSYSFGRIGRHKVVVACIQAGVYGPVAAATVATSMITTFPNIRFGLLVGIGGAIPRLNSRGDTIRLGDVAISQPMGANGGVFQHDLVKVLSGAPVQSKSFLNKPPSVLLNALERMKGQHGRRPSKVPHFLTQLSPQMLEPEEGPGYAHQGPSNDRLFEASYQHLGGPDCSECASNSEIVRVPRKLLDPKFHYGVIASGSTLCKDANVRDHIKEREPDCICIEMEAAGLMNDFPCLVIRGISDYSDSHKNDIWQPYAAATAAAYAKEFLGYVRPQEIAGAEKATKIIKSIEKIEHQVKKIHDSTKRTEVSISERKIEEWLSPPDPSRNYVEAIGKHHPGTGNWFLDGEKISQWKKTRNSFIWLHGMPGCGKTVLSSATIYSLKKEWENESKVVIYFYFDFKSKEKQRLDQMARSLMFQLFKAHPGRCEAVNQLFTDSRKGSEQPTRKALLETLQSSLRRFNEVILIIDAVDEVDSTDKKALLEWIVETHKSSILNLHMLASSRKEADFEIALGKLGEPIKISRMAVFKDIETFVGDRIQHADEAGLGRWKNRPEINYIRDKITEGADGMFRLASLRLNVIEEEECINAAELADALETLPRDINDAYGRILKKIPAKRKNSALRLLQWLIHSRRVLYLDQLIDILAIDISKDQDINSGQRILQPMDIVRYVPSMVAIEKIWQPDTRFNLGQQVVQLTHSTVKEYLLSDEADPFFREGLCKPQAYSSIVRTSLALLNFLSIGSSCDYASVGFCACAWIEFTTYADKDPLTCAEILGFLENVPALKTWLRFYDMQGNASRNITFLRQVVANWYSSDDIRLLPTPLYIAVAGQMVNVVRRLLEGDAASQVNNCEAASWAGQMPQLEDYFAPFGFYCRGSHNEEFQRETALHRASWGQSKEIVSLLLDHGADMGVEGGEIGTALEATFESAKEDMISAFDQHLAKFDNPTQLKILNLPNLRRSIGKSVEYMIDHHSMYELFLESRGRISVALHIGTRYADWTLIDKIKLTTSPRTGGNLLHAAFNRPRGDHQRSDIELVESLVQIGVRADARDANGSTPLHYAIMDEPNWKTYLPAADTRSRLEDLKRTIGALISGKADVNQTDGYGRTPIHLAAKMTGWGVKVLRDSGASLEIEDMDGKIPWMNALEARNFQTAAFLCPKLDSNSGPDDLFWHSMTLPRGGNEDSQCVSAARMLLPHVIDLVMQNRGLEHGQTYLHAAIRKGTKGPLLEALIMGSERSGILAKDSCRMTPIHYAALVGHDVALGLLARRILVALADDIEDESRQTVRLGEEVQALLDTYNPEKHDPESLLGQFYQAVGYHRGTMIYSIIQRFLDQSLRKLKSSERQFGGQASSSGKRRSTISSRTPAMFESDTHEISVEGEDGCPKIEFDAQAGLLFCAAGPIASPICTPEFDFPARKRRRLIY